MTAFEYLSVALSFVLGLGVTHLLVSGSRLFTRREQVSFDWIALTWAATIFVHQIHFWWVVFALSDQAVWSFEAFVMLLAFGLLLFLAGALVLPDVDPGEMVELEEHFLRTGRWALVAVFVYDLVGIPFDFLLYDAPLVSGVNFARIPYLVVLIAAFITRPRPVRGILAVSYLLGLLYWIDRLAPASY